MSSIGKYEMLDGRIITVDFADYKSVKKVKKKDWLVIRTILRCQLEFIKSPSFDMTFKANLKSLGFI